MENYAMDTYGDYMKQSSKEEEEQIKEEALTQDQEKAMISGKKRKIEEEEENATTPSLPLPPPPPKEDRFKSILKMMSNPKKTSENLSASVTIGSASGTSVKLIITSFKVNDQSATAPVQVDGVLVHDVGIPHSPYKLEPLFEGFEKRTPDILPAGSLTTLSVFMKEPSKRAKLAILQPLLVSGLTWNMNVAFKETNVKGLDSGGDSTTEGEEGGGGGIENISSSSSSSADGKVRLWDRGDLYMCYTAKECAFINMSQDAIYEALGRAYIGPTAKYPNYQILSYPQDAPRVTVMVKPSKAKPEEELSVIHPNFISNEILRSRQYPNQGIFFHIRNMTYLDEKFSSSSSSGGGGKGGGLCMATCTVPTEKFTELGKAEIAHSKRGQEGVAFLAIRGKDKKNTQAIWLPSGDVGVCQSCFYQDEVNKLGVFHLEIAKNCLPGLVTYLDAVVFVELDKSARPNKDPQFSFVCVGNAKFLKVHYMDMFSNAGLEVSIDAAYEILMSFDTKKSLSVRGFKSDYSSVDENFKQFRSNPELPPPVLCLNSFTGEFNHDLMPGLWRVFAVPPTDAYRYDEHFAETDPLPIHEIMAEQRFATKTDLEANKAFIKDAWGSCLKRVTFFAVRNTAPST
jgi:hypothetical protein